MPPGGAHKTQAFNTGNGVIARGRSGRRPPGTGVQPPEATIQAMRLGA